MRLLFALSLIALWATVGGPAAATDAPEEDSVCVVAAELVEDADPQRAVRLVAETRELTGRGALCEVALQDAAAAVVEARTLLSSAETARDAAVSLDEDESKSARRVEWERAQELAGQAAALDGTLKEAAALEKEATAKVDALDAGPGSRDAISEQSDAWDTFLDEYLKPLGRLVAVAAALMLGIVVLARLLVVLPPGQLVTSSSVKARRAVNIGALALLLTCGFVAAVFAPGWVGASGVDNPFWLGLFVVLTLLCVALVALSLATRLRLAITVSSADGKADPAGTTQIIALLRELGAESARGLEIPRGTDVDILDGKTIVEQSAGWAAALLRVVQSLAGFTPWSIVVDDKGDETLVIVTRNGRSFDSAVISCRALGEGEPELDTRKLAAAFVLVTIARGYAASDFAGLAGATSWRSLGLHYLATRDLRTPEAARKTFLHMAVNLDPQNLLAQVGLENERHRQSTEAAELRDYAVWLWRLAQRLDPGWSGVLPPGLEAIRGARKELASLRLRVLYSATATALNHNSIATDHLPAKLISDALTRQCGSLSSDKVPDGMAIAAQALARGAADAPGGGTLADLSGDLVLTSPKAEYNDACRLVQADLANNKGEAIALLRKVVVTPGERDTLKSDPSLEVLRAEHEFRRELGVEPRSSMLDVPPFDTYAEPLRALALLTPQDLLSTTLPRSELAEALGVHPWAINELRESARLVRAIPKTLDPMEHEIAAAAHQLGYDLAGLAAHPDHHELAKEIVGVVAARGCADPDRTKLVAWLGTL